MEAPVGRFEGYRLRVENVSASHQTNGESLPDEILMLN